MKRDTFRFAMLFIAGTTRAWYQYAVCALLAIVVLLPPFVGKQVEHITDSDAAELAAIFSAIVWLIAINGSLATLRQLWELRSPQVYRHAARALALVALLTLIAPSVVLVLTGHDLLHFSEIADVFMTLLLGAVAGALIATLPRIVIFLCAILVAPISVLIHSDTVQWLLGAPWQRVWVLGAITLLALFIVVRRCKSTIESEATARGAWASVAEMRVNASNQTPVAAQDPDTAYRMFTAWMNSSARTRAGASLWSRISTLLGPPFAPGNFWRQLLMLGVVIGSFSMVSMAHGELKLPVLVLLMLSPVRLFGQRLRMIYSAKSGELAEFALLPHLGNGKSALAVYCQVLLGRPLLMVATLTCLVTAAALLLTGTSVWIFLVTAIVAAMVVIDAARYMKGRREFIEDPILDGLAYFVLLTPLGALVFVSTVTSNGKWQAVVAAIAILMWAMAIRNFRRAYIFLEQLPHPFLSAQERRVRMLS